jgi:sugar/nucleoside kinase (ribokinase family)
LSEPLDLLVVGDANPDLVLSGGDVVPAFGQRERLVERASLTIGGSAAITACGAARLGLRTALVAAVGDDVFGRWMLESLAERGVEVGGCVVRGDLDTGLTVVLSRGDDRAVLTAEGAIGALREEMVDRGRLRSARHVHFGSLYLQPGLAAGAPALVREARAAGATTSADTNWDPSERWEPLAVLEAVDVLVPNAGEALALSGSRDGDLEAALDTLSTGGRTVAVTLGPEGAVARAGGTTVRAPAVAVEVADTTGAGDTFTAGLIAGRLRGLPPADALRLACACGSLSARAAGGTGSQPTLDEALRAAAL